MGALASAIMRPQIGYYDSLIEEAAAMLESLDMNHPFVDGNKRTAFADTDTFLRKNGSFIECDGEEAHDHFMHLFETNSFRFAELRSWLEEHVKPLPGALPASVQQTDRLNFELLKESPRHPSLRFRNVGRCWSARVSASYRPVAVQDGGDFIWFWIGDHDEYLRVIGR